MRRHTLGVIALSPLVLGALLVLGISAPSGSESFAGGAIKTGLVLGALWLALPQIDSFLARTPGWLIITTLIGIVLMVLRPFSAILILPLLAAIWMLSRKWKRK